MTCKACTMHSQDEEELQDEPMFSSDEESEDEELLVPGLVCSVHQYTEICVLFIRDNVLVLGGDGATLARGVFLGKQSKSKEKCIRRTYRNYTIPHLPR